MQALHSRTMKPEDYAKTIGFESNDPFSNDGFTAGWEYLKKLNDDKILADNITGYTISGAKTDFALQKAIMLSAVSLDIAELNESTTFEIGSFLMPPAPADILQKAGLTLEDMANAPLISGVYTDVLVLNSNTSSEKQTIAKELFRFILSDAAQEKLLEYDLLPVRSNVSFDKINPSLSCIKDNISKGISGFYQSFSINAIDIKVKDAGVGVILGKTTPAAATESIADFYKQNVANYR